MHAINSTDLIPKVSEEKWTPVLPVTKLGPHRQHQFQLENVGIPFTHVRVTIYPDGGIKRVRIFGRRIRASSELENANEPAAEIDASVSPAHKHTTDTGCIIIPALTLTPEAFAPFGKVVQGYEDLNAVPSPRTARITGANQGTAVKFHKQALLESFYPPDAGATAGLSIYRCKPIQLTGSGSWEVKLLERHPATNQAFIPMGGSSLGEAVKDPGHRYLVIVAPTADDGKPDLKGLRAFVASAAQGIMYHTGTWRKRSLFFSLKINLICYYC
jgi:allantoicase